MTERLAVDIGGTFVDAIFFNRETGEISVEKASTTPDEPESGVLTSIEKVGANLRNAEAFVHGTTLGLNAVLERDGATTGIITNDGFRDVYEIGRTNTERESMYDIRYQKPESLVARRRRVGVPGRLNADGEEVEPLDEDAVRDAAAYLVEERDVDGIAVCFLHSYRNPDHERQAAEIVRDAYPDVSVSISSAITREYREYERTSTAVMDAYIKPIFETYIKNLDAALADRGFDAPFFVTRSGGGTLTAESATDAPVHTILSGPAGGLIGASHVGRETGRENLITVDMGGTSLDACVIEDGMPAVKYDSRLEHQPLMIPVYDIRTIGAGGGSIAWLDGELLKVGPRSAGADPGPVAYGRGGTEPTVTDAAVALGYIDPDDFLGGEMELDAAGARGSIEEALADPLDSSVTDVSRGVFDVALANTVGAIREITIEKGLDPREFSMMAFGGAGPMFVPLLAREMGVDEVVVPEAPSVFSAMGMLMADVVYDFARTNIAALSDLELLDVETTFEELDAEAIETLTAEGFEEREIDLEHTLEMRYLGQEHTVEVDANSIASIDEVSDRFERKHEDRYGHAMDDPPEVVHQRVRAIGRNDKPPLEREEPVDASYEPVETRDAYCFAVGERTAFDVYDRGDLRPGASIDGPAVVREPTTTIVFHSDQMATVDEYGQLVISRGEA
ncbi:hydantoinase/oxoprolinase family protein [Natrialba asiatica]|uniref:N-methylhydantoinase A (ATP-hydrolyzing) n=1 Tax=Natrialba asiatica (strain ATCC 700177 / DSM 12278 / JCM 9576 / FERM P-10747 / NBRC 102637 / 172P1) TaxID=29540 RepID=M0AEI8_NATA1|nr:hydantoinase/oxoprolinase family protein [Natrialba asiatica]ELY97155.1 N-methylhydantoinase A (ATP-hydrolyzing) [Natrialba asiatica DSM 12278]